jgi:Rrf2 family protein
VLGRPEGEGNVRGPGANVKTQYAVQAVIYLARQERIQVAPVSEIAAAVGISPKFLEDILGALRVAGIVQSRRGKEGGYQLVPAPGDLSVLEVVQAVEGPVIIPTRQNDGPMAQVTAQAFDRALDAAMAALAATTIEQLIGEAVRLEAERGSAYMYHL